MTVRDIMQYDGIIKSIIDNSKNVNTLIKFKLLGMCKQFEPIVANFETIRNEKIAENGTANESGGISILPPDKENFENDEDYEKARKEFDDTLAKINEELNEILDSEADITIKKFKATEIIESGIPASYLIDIYDLIEE